MSAAVELPQSLEHSFTPEDEPGSKEAVEPVLERLCELPVETAEEAQAFLRAWNETSCWIGDYVAKARVASRSFTEDEEAQARWTNVVTQVLPTRSRYHDKLARKLLDSPQIEALSRGEYGPFIKQVRVDVQLFREENVELEQQVDELANRYQQISGSWAIEFDGEPRTMSQMQRYLAASDRDTRRAAWWAVREEVAKTRDEVEDLFEQLFALRQQIAKNAGFDNFRDYIFVAKNRDYGPEDCHALAELVDTEVAGLMGELADWTTDQLGVESYKPWDMRAEPDGGEPLRPFEQTEALKDGVERMMRRLDEGLGERFAQIRGNMDLESRPGKAQGGFATWYSWERRPFIFANASGNHSDIIILVHEAGHAFHGLLADEAGSRPMSHTYAPVEFNEVASMAMESLTYDTLDEFYDVDDRERAIHQHLRRVVRLLGSVAQGDQFQHWLYTHPDHTRSERRAKWVELMERYAGHVDNSGIDREYLEDVYHGILHFFVVPFYFIEYGFAQLGSLQVTMNAEEDLAGTMEAYKSALSLGPQRDVRGLYEAAGVEFVPTRETVREAMDWVRRLMWSDSESRPT